MSVLQGVLLALVLARSAETAMVATAAGSNYIL
jgi:hypothetical protein